MASYTIISDIGSYMLKLLREKICPEPLLNTQSIDFVSPADENSDYTLGIFLYDIKENMEHVDLKMTPTSDHKLRFPPHSFTLYYMIYVNASAQIGIKSLDAQKIFAKVSQTLYDMPPINIDMVQSNLEQAEDPAKLAESRLSFDEKIKIWSALNKPMQLALYYNISPILISSEKIMNAPRVTRSTYHIKERK